MSKGKHKRKKKRVVRERQGELFKGRGGRREGAGRKPKGERAGASHRTREDFSRHDPVHVTCKLVAGLPNLREGATFPVVRDALLDGAERGGFRIVEFSVQSTHLHLIVEAEGREALSSGMRGVCVRIARRLNRAWKRAGRVFAERFHARVLGSPREVRNALRYVLGNAKRHGLALVGLDPCSSAPWFEGWRGDVPMALEPLPLPGCRTWLLRVGWRIHGLLRPT